MEIILKEDIIGLGYKDDVLTVKDGYGRNYLIPQGKAIVATSSAKKMQAENLKQRAHKLKKIKEEAEVIAESMKDLTISVGAKTSTTGKIFGSVGNIQLAEVLAAKGFDIDRKLIVIKDSVKEVGTYKAIVKLHKEVSVELAFEVVSE